ncbi:hypothetical protein [Kordia sp.]|uniref:hypothetical protein n=1 Tax=Kordia sp. TaxID=1965332 RepID=UPI003B5C8BAA
MKKKKITQRLTLAKKQIAAFKDVELTGGNTGNCPPPTIYDICRTRACTANNCGTANCGTNATCVTDAALSCTPRGCGNSLFNC